MDDGRPIDAGVLVHLTTPEAWAAAQASGALAPPSLEAEGFVHLCRPDQLPGVVDRYYRHLDEAVVVVVDPARLAAEVRWEPGPTGERFPHLYGPLPVDAAQAEAVVRPSSGDAVVAPRPPTTDDR